ncbi:MAG TPA: DUF2891 domain-containing protein [Steroidobacteraceae bacterium]|nr:DUF2891 domain-containing protein [Steroidobacteraceae bacterium]
MSTALTPTLGARLARIALGHLRLEYPNKLDHVITGPGDVKSPRELHPVFFGSFDWHSCVHGHWLLARLYRRFPGFEAGEAIRAMLDEQLTDAKVAGEVAYLSQPATRGFERPYGWAWLLMLQGELLRHATPEGRRWAAALAPLAEAFERRFLAYLPIATYPVRAGVHSNSAFALLLARDYAAAGGRVELGELCAAAARRWYESDQACQAWEPSQDEFLSPALMEAALMADVLAAEEFRRWFAAFLPDAPRGAPATLFSPATVSDRSDGKIAHLDGLNLSRAWCWRRILAALPPSDPLCALGEPTAARHLSSALDQVAGDYMGEHWLASFALLALDPVSA